MATNILSSTSRKRVEVKSLYLKLLRRSNQSFQKKSGFISRNIIKEAELIPNYLQQKAIFQMYRWRKRSIQRLMEGDNSVKLHQLLAVKEVTKVDHLEGEDQVTISKSSMLKKPRCIGTSI